MRILEVCVDLDGGGIDRYLLNYCSRIPHVQFDFAIIDSNKTGILEAQIEALGSKIFRIPRQRAGLQKNYNALKKILTENRYDAVHVHLGYRSAVALLCAKRCGIKTRIAHAHIASETEDVISKIIRKGSTLLVRTLATHLAACGEDAAKWVWGEHIYRKGKVQIHNNAVDTQQFRFHQDIRSKKRKELGIDEDTLVVGHVGRLCAQKNQERLLEIFYQIQNIKENAKLFLVGRGEDENKLLCKIRELGIEKKIVFLGVRSDVEDLLNAFDVFVFPSIYEGLPFTLIETQSNGLQAISSDAVTQEVAMCDCVRFLPLEASNEQWAVAAIEAAEKGRELTAWQQVRDAGYDIDTEAKHLLAYYKKCVGDTK